MGYKVKSKKKPVSKIPMAEKPNPSKFIGPTIFKYYLKEINVDIVSCLSIDQKKNESNEDFEKRAVKEAYARIKAMKIEFKAKARELKLI